MNSQPLLAIRSLTKRFGGVTALDGVSLEISRGEILGLIGPNGSGKTTMLNTVSGIHRPQGGTVLWDGRDITGWRPHRIARLGIARTFQQAMAFAELPVWENVAVAMQHVDRGRAPSGLQDVERILAFVGLGGLAAAPASALGFGHLRRLGLAVALGCQPHLLMLDEPAAGLNDGETAELRQLLVECRERGLTIVVIDHDMNLMMRLCDRLVVLDFGRKIAEGTPAEVGSNREVLSVYLGEPV